MPLYPYQKELNDNVARLVASGKKRIMVQSPTGSGKGVILASLAHRFLAAQRGKVVIAAHREKIVMQCRKELYTHYSLPAHIVIKETKKIDHTYQVYVGMAETLYRRLEKPGYIQDVGMLICDEAHLLLFEKLLPRLNCLVVGFSATPISANKKKPLNTIYDSIVTGPQVSELIQLNRLTPAVTYAVKNNIDRKSFSLSMGDFNERQMGDEFSKTRHIKNVVEGYEKYCKGKKTIIFNCNVEHSKLVCDAFGGRAKHIDGYMKDTAPIWKWFETTPDAILCNCSIATTGVDVPSIECVIVNRSTTSVPLLLQMAGRGSRIFTGKHNFTILDYGDNFITHGLWEEDRDWADLFYNPPKPSKDGVAPVKDCVKCAALITASTTVCPYCQAKQPIKAAPVQIDAPVEFQLVTKNLDVRALCSAHRNRKPFFTLMHIVNNIATQAKYKTPAMSQPIYSNLEGTLINMGKQWADYHNVKWNWQEKVVKEKFAEQIKKAFPTWKTA